MTGGGGGGKEVSIHAPAGDATDFIRTGEYETEFQSTRLRETRLQRVRGKPVHFQVSIHAPAGDATDYAVA